MTFEPERNIATAAKTIAIAAAIGAVVGVLMASCSNYHHDAPTPTITQPAPEPSMNSRMADPPRVLSDQSSATIIEQPGNFTCETVNTPNGVRETCGPAHVDPVIDGCDDGMTRVCVRRYGIRRCDCYPE